MPRTTTQASAEAAAPIVAPTTAPKKRRKKLKQRAKARETVRRVNREVDARHFTLGQDKPRDLPVDGPARLLPAEIEPVTGILAKSTLDMLAFMEESITVRVQTTPERNAEPIIGVWVNGKSQYFPRGQNVTCKRKYVEQLARSRTTDFTQEEFIDGKGYKAIRNIPNTSLRYPFQVIRDDSPNAMSWLEKILAEA